LENRKNLNQQKKKQLNSYVKYSSLGLQMIISLCLAAWGGLKLDAYFNVKSHLITVFLMLFAVIGSLYLLVKSLSAGNDGESSQI
jgi:ATP synthase protein I